MRKIAIKLFNIRPSLKLYTTYLGYTASILVVRLEALSTNKICASCCVYPNGWLKKISCSNVRRQKWKRVERGWRGLNKGR